MIIQVTTKDVARIFNTNANTAWRLLSFLALVGLAKKLGKFKPSRGRPIDVFEIESVITIDLSSLVGDPERVQYEQVDDEEFLQPVS